MTGCLNQLSPQFFSSFFTPRSFNTTDISSNSNNQNYSDSFWPKMIFSLFSKLLFVKLKTWKWLLTEWLTRMKRRSSEAKKMTLHANLLCCSWCGCKKRKTMFPNAIILKTFLLWNLHIYLITINNILNRELFKWNLYENFYLFLTIRYNLVLHF